MPPTTALAASSATLPHAGMADMLAAMASAGDAGAGEGGDGLGKGRASARLPRA